MRTFSLLTVAALATFALAADKIKLTPKYEAGQRTKWKTELKLNASGMDAVLSGMIVHTVKSLDSGIAKIEDDWVDPKAIVDGEEIPIGFGPTSYSVNAFGELEEASGGIEGSDVIRTLLLMFTHLPKDDIEKDGKWTATYAKTDKLEIGERKVEGTYLGEEEVSGKKAHKFKTKTTEGDFTITMTYWMTLEGKTIKIDGDFVGLPVPAVSGIATGTVKAEIVE